MRTHEYKTAYGNWECHYCHSIFRTRRLVLAHIREDHKEEYGEGKIHGVASKKWREDNKEKCDKLYKKLGKLTSERRRGKPGHKWSEEDKKRISEQRIKYLETHNAVCKWYECSNGIKVQGTWELRVAETLIKRSIKFERKRIMYQKTHRYTPDFYLPDYDLYLEVKGFRRNRDIYKMYLVLEEHPNLKIKMIEREQMKSLESLDFASLKNFQELYSKPSDESFKNVWNIPSNGGMKTH